MQLAGTTLYLPLLVGGVIGGIASDRFDRLMTVRLQMLIIAPITVLVGLLVRAGNIEVWMIYGYMFLMGIGWVSDMTSRRALVFDLVGEKRLDNAMAMEALSLSLGMVFGALVGGYAIEAVGIGASYFFIAALALSALIALAPVTSPEARVRDEAAEPEDGPASGYGALRGHKGLVSILGVTVIANFFLFSYFPIIPVIAEDLDAAPFLVGLLAAGTGIGMMTGSLITARLAPRRRGIIYLLGLAVALVFVIPFGVGNSYGLVLAAIIVSGIGSGFFGATQSTLVMAAVPEHARGRALGLLSMAIGSLPAGMYVLGEIAERTGASAALVINSVIGLVVLALWILRRPEVITMTTADA